MRPVPFFETHFVLPARHFACCAAAGPLVTSSSVAASAIPNARVVMCSLPRATNTTDPIGRTGRCLDPSWVARPRAGRQGISSLQPGFERPGHPFGNYTVPGGIWMDLIRHAGAVLPQTGHRTAHPEDT